MLDSKEISRLAPDTSGETLYEQWQRNYYKEVGQAKSEDYVKHFLTNYEEQEIPIWAATGVMSLGTLVRLYQFLPSEDRRSVSVGLGLGSQPQIKNHLLAYRTLRNHCSHGARVWNRNFTHTNPQIPSHVRDNTWDHLLHPNEPREQARLYRLAELLAYLIISIQPSSNWPRTFATLIKKFPKAEGIRSPYVQSPEWSMGFPTGWSDLPIWNYEPKRSLRK